MNLEQGEVLVLEDDRDKFAKTLGQSVHLESLC